MNNRGDVECYIEFVILRSEDGTTLRNSSLYPNRGSREPTQAPSQSYQ